jgi:predicted metal-dependent phosphoesterase TrpH
MTLENDTSIETMRVDLHCHSEASSDCWTPLEAFLTRCPQEGIAVQAITDHNEIWGAVKLQEMVAEKQETLEAPLTIIVGEEISSSQGEIIGLFLKEKIEPGLSPEETVQQIKDQDGLVLLPHGFDVLKRWRLKSAARRQIAEQIDIVEAFNARISLRYWNRRAASWAREREIHLSAGSDAHTPGHMSVTHSPRISPSTSCGLRATTSHSC